MRNTDITIVGGGVAGAATAAMLGKAGIDAVIVDPRAVYPFDFRCEKLDGSQVALLKKTGLDEGVLRAATPDTQVWIIRNGRLAEMRPNDQYDIHYDGLVNSLRAQIPRAIEFRHRKVTALSTSAERQTVTLADGEQISSRLIVLATGLNHALRNSLGIERKIASHCHSVSIGFDLRPKGRRNFAFQALTYYPEHITDRMAYMTLFPLRDTLRGNLFIYRDMRDRWLKGLGQGREESLFELMPSLQQFTGPIEISRDIHIRPVDLTVTEGYRQSGVVLIGDAFATSCPAAGTGMNKVFTDVERLCNVHIPQWLSTGGMGTEKIGAFYNDPVKRACDAHSTAKAYYLRSLSTDSGLVWAMRRWARVNARASMHGLRRLRDSVTPKLLYPPALRPITNEASGTI